MNILIVNTLPVPSGQASVNRILSLSKGLVELNDNVTILSTGKGVDNLFHSINGIKYCNLQRTNGFIGLLNSLREVISYVKKNHDVIDVLWLVTNSVLLIYPIWLLCRVYKIKYIQEKSEFPFVLMQKGVFNKIWSWFYVHTIYKLCDGMIIMTQPLIDYFSNLVRKDCQIIKIPMTVDMSRFDDTETRNEFGDYAAYCGDMSGNKDGVENLIESFSYVEKKHPDFKLVLIGGAKSELEFEHIKSKVGDLKLKNVIFTGRVSREDVPRILKNAKVLCLARPSSLQSFGGFPTKLGEYLSTSNPVVVTAVGEIPNYLNDTNSFLVEPDNNELFGEAINQVLADYAHAQKIGKEGYMIASNNFNYKSQSCRLHDFFLRLNK